MRLSIAIILCFATTLYGWTGTIAAHIEEQCHVVEGEHHEEALADHVDDHHHDAEEASHEDEDDCKPEHCSDHCRTCHVSSLGFISLIEHREQDRSPALKEFSANDLDTPDSIAARPDTPPPKA